MIEEMMERQFFEANHEQQHAFLRTILEAQAGLLQEWRQVTDALVASQSRADGYALLVGELRASMVNAIDGGIADGGWIEVQCLICGATWLGAFDADRVISHESDCILAADPEARAIELLAAQKESAL